jgi:hypothetical protein
MIPGLDKPKTRTFLFAAFLLHVYACSFKEKEQRLIISSQE